MSTIRLEILPWLSRSLSGDDSARVALDREIVEGDTVRDVLDRLAAEHPSFGRTLYDPSGELAVHVSIILNNRLFELAGGLEAKLEPGDTVCLLPAFSGG